MCSILSKNMQKSSEIPGKEMVHQNGMDDGSPLFEGIKKELINIKYKRKGETKWNLLWVSLA